MSPRSAPCWRWRWWRCCWWCCEERDGTHPIRGDGGGRHGRPYAARLAAIAEPAPARPQGKPAPDGRLAFIKRLLAGWPAETITARELTEALCRHGFEVQTGLLVQTAPARHRIVRTHPEIVAAGNDRPPRAAP